jgi:hypothetical protein
MAGKRFPKKGLHHFLTIDEKPFNQIGYQERTLPLIQKLYDEIYFQGI